MSKQKNTKTAIGSLLSQAREPVDTDTQEPANIETRENVYIGKPEKLVTMTISTKKQVKNYWIIEARKRGTTVSKMVKEYLESELGLPE